MAQNMQRINGENGMKESMIEEMKEKVNDVRRR